MNNKHTVTELIHYFKHQTPAVLDQQSITNELEMQQADSSSLAIKILSISGGIFATLTLLGFLLLAGFYDSEISVLIFGFVFVAAGLVINKIFQKTITDTLSVCAYLTGHGLIAFAIMRMDSNENIICIMFISISLIALYVTQTLVLSFIASLTALMSLFAMIFIDEVYNAIHAYVIVLTVLLTYVLLNEARIITKHRNISTLYAPVSMALIVALVISLGFFSISDLNFITIDHIWVSSIATITAVLFVLTRILKIYEVEKMNMKIAACAAVAFTLLPTLFAPEISGALLILLLCFLIQHKIGLVLGIVSFIYFISQFYYDLQFTLLMKSLILFSTGVLCLLFYIFFVKKIESNESI